MATSCSDILTSMTQSTLTTISSSENDAMLSSMIDDYSSWRDHTRDKYSARYLDPPSDYSTIAETSNVPTTTQVPACVIRYPSSSSNSSSFSTVHSTSTHWISAPFSPTPSSPTPSPSYHSINNITVPSVISVTVTVSSVPTVANTSIKSRSLPAVVGGAVGSAAFLALLFLAILLLRRSRRQEGRRAAPYLLEQHSLTGVQPLLSHPGTMGVSRRSSNFLPLSDDAPGSSDGAPPVPVPVRNTGSIIVDGSRAVVAQHHDENGESAAVTLQPVRRHGGGNQAVVSHRASANGTAPHSAPPAYAG